MTQINSTNENKLPNAKYTTTDDSTYYPSKKDMQGFSNLAKKLGRNNTRDAIIPGMIARTDGFDVDQSLAELDQSIIQLDDNNPQKQNLLNLKSRVMSVSDLTPKLYDHMTKNKNSLFNWIQPIEDAIKQADNGLKSPKTSVYRLPIELAQFTRIEYQETTQHDRELFNRIIFDALKLEEDKTYFIKTGNFSSKFQFANAKCSEPLEMGEYFQVINNFAMTVGAGLTVDVVAREYIEDVENNPTIYNGMPLRTEFRAFIDFDTNEVIGVVPYWHPIVMKRALKMGLSDSMDQDYQTYLVHEDKLTREFNENVNHVRTKLAELAPHVQLQGQYSVDVMKNGEDFYVIDIGLMMDSALTELL